MVIQNMLPAICFVLSRKALELCAKEISVNLLEDDSKVPYIVRNECEQIIRKLPNYQEYLELPEYNHLVSLLEKGIAIHHAGIMPILREMVELLFAKGYIKLLFATETFAVGINMPTKSVLFTDMNKFDGNGSRPLLSHEYTQMAGRAGRRGKDKFGLVVYLPDRDPATVGEMKVMMKGGKPALTSRMDFHYDFLLKTLQSGGSCCPRSLISPISCARFPFCFPPWLYPLQLLNSFPSRIDPDLSFSSQNRYCSL